MKTPDRYTTETYKRPHLQLAEHLARPHLMASDAQRRYRANLIVPATGGPSGPIARLLGRAAVLSEPRDKIKHLRTKK